MVQIFADASLMIFAQNHILFPAKENGSVKQKNQISIFRGLMEPEMPLLLDRVFTLLALKLVFNMVTSIIKFEYIELLDRTFYGCSFE